MLTLANSCVSEDYEHRVRFVHGANEESLPVEGKSVAWARVHLRDSLNIAPDAIALVEGVEVPEDRVLNSGETLEFLRTRGKKGLGEVFDPEALIERMKMSREDLDRMIEEGLPVHRLRDGSLRITETQLDRFLDLRTGLGRPESKSNEIELPENVVAEVDHTERRPAPEPLMLTVEDLASLLQISVRELWRKRSSGKLPGAIELGPKHIRWRRDEILAWVVAGCPVRATWEASWSKRDKAPKGR